MALQYIFQKVLSKYYFLALLIRNLGRKGGNAIYIFSKIENDKTKATGILHSSIKNMTNFAIPRITENLYVA